MTGFVEDVLDELGLDRTPVVAQSMGGLFATWLAFSRPERLGAISCIGCRRSSSGPRRRSRSA
jgi:pimeloyl-ACP methyl ester carboxylesterase